MIESLTPVIAVIVLFGVVIFVHELGHFVAAKLMGVYAPRFSIGFGPALWRKRWGETEYILAALPLGGYVRMASREDEATAFLEGGPEVAPEPHTVGAGGTAKAFDEERVAGPSKEYDPEAMVPFGPKPVPEHRWFESKRLPARLFILLAGVTMNFLLALVVMIGVAAGFGRTVLPTRVVGEVDSLPGAPALAQVQSGDTIVTIDGQPVRTWNDIGEAIAEGTGDTVRLGLHRGEVSVPVSGSGAPTRTQVLGALAPQLSPVVGQVLPGGPAERSGMEGGDSVVAVAGTPVESWADMVRIVSASPGRPLEFTVARDGSTRELVITPDSTPAQDPSGGTTVVGRIGAQEASGIREPIPLSEAIPVGWRATLAMSTVVLDALRGIATREVGLDNLGGPVAIVRVTVQASRGGLETFLQWLSLISVNIAIFNLLPIPILDGGQILLNVAESIKGRAFSARTREYIARAGLLAIALLFILVMFNDIRSLVRSFL